MGSRFYDIFGQQQMYHKIESYHKIEYPIEFTQPLKTDSHVGDSSRGRKMTFWPGGQGQGHTSPHLPLLDLLARDLVLRLRRRPGHLEGPNSARRTGHFFCVKMRKPRPQGLHADRAADRPFLIWLGAGGRPVCEVDGVLAGPDRRGSQGEVDGASLGPT